MSGISYPSGAVRRSDGALRTGNVAPAAETCLLPLGPPERAAEAIGTDLVSILAGLDGVDQSEANRTLALLRPGTLLTLQSCGIVETAKPRIVGGGQEASLTEFGWSVIHWCAQQTEANRGLRPPEAVQAVLRAAASNIKD